MTTLKVSSTPKLPLDPSLIQTMADYDLALCLYRTWFNYDNSRKAIPGIISSWKFDKKNGSYNFLIEKKASWSDGSPLTSEHLIKNLERLIRNKKSYGSAIDSIIDFKNIKIIDQQNFIIPTKNKEPSEAFFQRMGSIFLAITHPNDWDTNGNLIHNNLTIGPYKINEKSATDLILTKNAFDKLSNESRIEKIHYRLGLPPSSIDDFINGNTFEEITQTYTLMSNELYNKIISMKLPFWTRAFDRVSYIAPIKPFSENSEKLRNFIKTLGIKFQTSLKNLEVPSNVKIANSLQPKGYPLHVQLHYELEPSEQNNLPNEVSILAIDGDQLKIHRPIIDSLVATMNPIVKIKWVIKPTIDAFLKELTDKSPYDFKILSFGVADPEAATWLSLVLNKENPFIELSKKDTEKFEKIMNNHSGNHKEVLDLKNLLTSIGERGSYLPLFHFSTMSIAQPGISFEKISELDETVDYSKLIKQ